MERRETGMSGAEPSAPEDAERLQLWEAIRARLQGAAQRRGMSVESYMEKLRADEDAFATMVEDLESTPAFAKRMAEGQEEFLAVVERELRNGVQRRDQA